MSMAVTNENLRSMQEHEVWSHCQVSFFANGVDVF